MQKARSCFALLGLALLGAFWAAPLCAAVERVEILERTPFASGRAFGTTGPYEKIKGRLHYAIDPAAAANTRIVDLQLAPRDARGLVIFSGDFLLLRPIDLARGNHRLLYEVNNRGNLGMLATFNEADWSNDPTSAADAGSGFLMAQGYSLLWSAWNWDVVPGDDRLQIELPIATEQGAAITGPVAAEFIVNRWTQAAPFMWGDSRGYPPVSLDEPGARLTVGDEQRDPRQEIPRDAWQFARIEKGRLVPDPTQVFFRDGFEPGRIYELRYTARDPRVVGLGLAAIRDALSFFRHAPADADGTPNPLAATVP